MKLKIAKSKLSVLSEIIQNILIVIHVSFAIVLLPLLSRLIYLFKFHHSS